MGIQATASPNYQRTLLHVYRSSDWTEWDGSLPIDLTADMEVTGSSISFGTARPVASGDITLVTVGATERLKLHKAFLNSKADFNTSPIILLVGSNEKGSLVSVKDGGQYLLVSADVDFNVNALGDDLIITIPVGMENNCSINFTYEIM